MGLFKQRSLKNYLLYPEVQVRTAVFLFFTVVIGAICAHLLIRSYDHDIYLLVKNSLGTDTTAADAVIELQRSRNRDLLLVGALTGFSLIMLTIYLTHRFLGPMVMVLKYLESLRTNQKGQLSRRPYDALNPLIDFLRENEITVKKKSNN